MTRMRDPGPVTVTEVLLRAHRRTASTASGGRVALYLVRLTEKMGLALAVAVRRRTGGPDPVLLLERAVGLGADEPLMTGSASVDHLAQALDDLDILEEAERRLLGWAVHELHRAGEIPLLVMLAETAIVTSLSEFTSWRDDAAPIAWAPPAAGEG